ALWTCAQLACGNLHTCPQGATATKKLDHAQWWASTQNDEGPQVVGFIKGKSAIHLARVYGERRRNFVGQHFWARGYFVSTVGRDTELIRRYIREQEAQDRRTDQLQLLR
ncbi:MAG: transposase, partial [Candidatus Cloacimonetes bacterium]|nr:transposase [Candidatus Cloacimonadota bacterium]